MMQIKAIWLTDPAGGGMMESPGLIIVQHRNIRIVAQITMPDKPKFDPGELRVTQGALDKLGADGVQRAFEQFIRCEWSDMPQEDKRANDVVVKYRTGILYDFPTPETMTVGYVGDNSTLILRSEY